MWLMSGFSCLYISQRNDFRSSLWPWSTDEYVFSQSPLQHTYMVLYKKSKINVLYYIYSRGSMISLWLSLVKIKLNCSNCNNTNIEIKDSCNVLLPIKWQFFISLKKRESFTYIFQVNYIQNDHCFIDKNKGREARRVLYRLVAYLNRTQSCD